MDIFISILFLVVIGIGIASFRHSDHQPHLPESKPSTSEFVAPPYAIRGTTTGVFTVVREDNKKSDLS